VSKCEKGGSGAVTGYGYINERRLDRFQSLFNDLQRSENACAIIKSVNHFPIIALLSFFHFIDF
jgi:hypothetical protein